MAAPKGSGRVIPCLEFHRLGPALFVVAAGNPRRHKQGLLTRVSELALGDPEQK